MWNPPGVHDPVPAAYWRWAVTEVWRLGVRIATPGAVPLRAVLELCNAFVTGLFRRPCLDPRGHVSFVVTIAEADAEEV